MATYSKTSPYYGTGTWGPFLDIWPGKTIATSHDDAIYQIDTPYHMRPDLLAYDIYSDANLWWVFAVRNPDVILDPLTSFTQGTIIYVPTLATVKASLGLL